VIAPPLLLLATLLASPVTLDGTLVAEGRAGSSPQIAGQGTEAFAGVVVSPQVELSLHDERGEARLAYLPRLVWQTPNLLGYEARPLVLHQANLALSGRLSSTTDGTASAFGSIGQPDYTVLPQLLGPGQAALPQAQTIVTGRGAAFLQHLLTRRLRLTLGANFSYFKVLDESAPSSMAPAPGALTPFVALHQTFFAAIPGALYAVTRNDDLLLTAAVSYGTYTDDIAIVSVSPQLMWRARRPPVGDELRLAVGVSYARDSGSRSVLAGGSAFLPMGSAEIVHGLVVEDSVGLHVGARLMVEQYVDPVLAVSGPRATSSGGVMLTLPPSWSFAVQGDVTASLRRTALAPANNPDETSFSLRVPIRHRFSSVAVLEWGALWADRAPAVAAPDFHFHQRQLWAYIALTLTTRDVSPWSIR
jgi:hypothetical protein